MRLSVCVVFSLLRVAAFAATAPGSLEGLDSFITAEIKTWKVPGVAVAVVQDGKLVVAKGYGLRNVKENLTVTNKTLFAIGSISKSFTVTALGILADEGKMDWDRPVREYMPDFRLYDQVATERMTPRDLVTHRSGLPRHDLLWYGSPFTRQQLYERLRYLEPSKDIRAAFQYNNLMFMTAGILAGRLADLTWEECVRQKILRPLGMQGANFSVLDSQKSADFSLPYRKVKEEVQEVPFRNIDAIGPAGSINSSIDDMGQYLLFHLNQGQHDGKHLLSQSNALQMQTPQMAVQGDIQFAELGHSSYGMGWSVSTYRGRKWVQHGGGIDGFISLLSFLPQEKIGVMVLTNLSPNPLASVITYNVFDRLLGLDQVAWSARFQKNQQQGEDAENEAWKRGLTPRKGGTRPSHELKEYAGEYEHRGYGRVKIEPAQEGFQLAFNRMTSPLKHFHYDVFEVPENPLDPLEKMKVQFHTNVSGDVDRLTMALEPNVREIVFDRLPDRQMREKAFLQAFVGQYKLAGTTFTISLKGNNVLALSTPGQPERELAPRRGTTFDLQGLTGASVEFRSDASGAVTEMILYRPGSTVVVKRKPGS